MPQFIPTYLNPGSAVDTTGTSIPTLIIIFTVLACASMQISRRLLPDIVNILQEIGTVLAPWYFSIAGEKFPGYPGPASPDVVRSYDKAIHYLEYHYEEWRCALPIYKLAEPFNPTPNEIYIYSGRSPSTTPKRSLLKTPRRRAPQATFSGHIPSRMNIVLNMDED
ncbi:uncharacterized protein H6S33_007551 [Morchella sextelata]|uniref:uncharacterized protein n=1 Tax=Morchella sextelata TaxID=1174677 RepID=UPI001D04BE95|nr:uncharacterized protein H6S33_007551 [Morchella sextelata]KAH0603892.1 hypothetical protein H6S33_007551 [Morchella sextelata]